MPRNITYPTDIDHIILMGGTPLLPTLAKQLMALGYTISSYTSPRQEAEIGPHEGVTICVTDDINRDMVYELLSPTTLAIGLGEAWVFDEKIRNALGDRLIDYMSIPLPRYRGGAHFSWAIMRGEREWGGCLQLVTANTVPGEVDDGEIVARWEYPIPDGCRIPQQWFDYTGAQDLDRILYFLRAIRAGTPFNTERADEGKSLFLPRLRTADNGWIDWSQSSESIMRFIYAFDDPYPGAKSMLHDPGYGDREVSIKGVTWNTIGRIAVPYQRGLVTRTGNGVSIATTDGAIVARRVLCNGMDFTDRVKVGMRFYVPAERLESALIATPIYTPKATAQ